MVIQVALEFVLESYEFFEISSQTASISSFNQARETGYLFTYENEIGELLKHLVREKKICLYGTRGGGKRTTAFQIAEAWLRSDDKQLQKAVVILDTGNSLTRSVPEGVDLSGIGKLLIVIPNLHINFNDKVKEVTALTRLVKDYSLLATVENNLPMYYTQMDDNPISHLLTDRSLFVERDTKQIVFDLVKKTLRSSGQELDCNTIAKQISEIAGDSIIGASSLIRKLANDRVLAESIAESRQPLIAANSILDSHADLLNKIKFAQGDQVLLGFIALAALGKYGVSVDEGFLTRPEGEGGLSLNMDSFEKLVEQPVVRYRNGMVFIVNQDTANVFVNAIHKYKTIATPVPGWPNALRKPNNNDIVGMCIKLYIAYGPSNLLDLSRKVCNDFDVLDLISNYAPAVDSISAAIMNSTDLNEATDLLINFEFYHHGLSSNLQKRLVSCAADFIPGFLARGDLGSVMRFISPFWYLSNDRLKKEGKKIRSEFPTKDQIECPFLVHGSDAESLVETTREILNSGLVDQTEPVRRHTQCPDAIAILKDTRVCIKALQYERLVFCSKFIIADQRPGKTLLDFITSDWIVAKAQNSDLKEIVYSLSIIRNYDPQKAIEVIQKISARGLVERFRSSTDTQSRIFLIAEAHHADPTLSESLKNLLDPQEKQAFQDQKWPW